MVDGANGEELKTKLRGELIRPGDTGYEEARAIYNGMISKRPALIARCADVADVIACVNFARETGLPLAVRGGGHNGAGLALCDDGLVVDLSRLRGVRVEPQSGTVRVEAGCTWGDVDHAAHAFGLAVPAGIVSTTGVAGLTLGGGHGYLSRKYGLTIDNLLAVDMVLADGRFITASDEEHEDLFWAVRGGGGNFGIVTSFLYQAQPVDTVYAGVTFWPFEKADEVLRWYRDFTDGISEDMYGFFALLKVPPVPLFPEELHTSTVCGIVWCYSGALENAEDAFRPVHEFGPPLFTHLGPMPFPALNSLFDPLLPPGLQWYWKGDFFQELSDEAIALHVKYGSEIPTLLSTMHLYPIDGAVQRVGKDETAFRYRDARWSAVYAGIGSDAANNEQMTRWAKEYWQALHPYSAGGAYVNFMMEEGQERVRATYGENYERLAQIKKEYDPANLFCVNQNIKPAA